MNTPVLLTPRGGIIKLSPLKNLLSVQPALTPPAPSLDDHDLAEQVEEEEIADDLRGPDRRPDEQQQPAAPEEIVMSLNSVCHTGQQMKFSLPGVPQALTLNFSAEALQVGPAINTGNFVSRYKAPSGQEGLCRAYLCRYKF